MTATRTGIAVFGMGRMGSVHVKNIIMSPRASLRWVVTENVEDAYRFRDEYDLDVKCTTPEHVHEALNDPSVNAVMIVTPTAMHETLIKKSLLAGKAVFCEKPLTSSVASTRACYDLAAEKNKPLMCAFNRRFDPSRSKAHSDVTSGKHGAVRVVTCIGRDYPFPNIEYLKISGGIFKDSTIHDIDTCCWIVGSKPRTVFAQGVAFHADIRAMGDNEHVMVVITYENGAMAVVDNARWSPFGHDARLEVLCEKTVLKVENKEVNHVTTASEVGGAKPRVEDNMGRYTDAYRIELEHFLDVVEEKAELLITKNEVIQAMRLAELCKESFDTQKVVPYSE